MVVYVKDLIPQNYYQYIDNIRYKYLGNNNGVLRFMSSTDSSFKTLEIVLKRLPDPAVINSLVEINMDEINMDEINKGGKRNPRRKRKTRNRKIRNRKTRHRRR
jgi:hypothetical protein